MTKNNKGQSMSMNVIIVAALALVVLVVLLVIFMGRMGGTRQTLDSCGSNGGQCTDRSVGCIQANYEKEVTGFCPSPEDKNTQDPNKVCCVKV